MSNEISLEVLSPTFTPLDEAVARLLPDAPGGSSGPGGWSARRTFMECAYKASLKDRRCGTRTDDVVVRRPSPALEIGSLFHLLAVNRYTMMIPQWIVEKCTAPGCKRGVLRVEGRATRCSPCDGTGKIETHKPGQILFDPAQFRIDLHAAGVNPEVLDESYRVFAAYEALYENEPLRPIAVEERVEVDGVSTRLDLVAEVMPNEAGWPLGVFIFEHKTASREDAATTEGWQNDGQLLIEADLYQRGGLAKKYGSLAGICVNIAFKTKVPKFTRLFLPVQPDKIRSHRADLKVWDAYRAISEATGVFPRNRASCITRYGLCEFFQHCAGV